MALSDILVCLDATPAGEVRMKLALALARASQAHLDGAYVLPETDGVREMGGAPAMRDAILGATAHGPYARDTAPPGSGQQGPIEAERAGSVAENFHNELRLNGIEGEWYLFGESEREAFIDVARTSDLTILGQIPLDLPEAAVPHFRPADVLMAAGRPVLVVPYVGAFESIGRRVLVAWDGSREASRALNDALPLLAHAEAVTVLYVGTGEASLQRARPSLDRVVRHLERHGLTAQAEESVRGAIAVSDVLLSRAADLGADLIVTGAYHHSQLRETLMGGISRELLEHMTVPVLMSH